MQLNHHILSHFIYTGDRLIKNGIITYSAEKRIISVEPTDLKHAERARTQFYSGIIVPDIYKGNTSAISLSEVVKNGLDPAGFNAINTEGMSGVFLLNLVTELQKKWHIYEDRFPDFWKKLSVNNASEVGEDYSVKPGNRIRVINLRGLDPQTFAIGDRSKLIPVERNLLL